MRLALFCKTCRNDLAWAYFALQSFRQNWRGSGEMVLVADLDCESEITKWDFKGLRVVYVKPWVDGYCHAMALKLCADLFLPGAELIWLFDSDMMLVRPTGLEDILAGGVPSLYYDVWHSDFEQGTRAMSRQVWPPAVWRSMGRTLEVDWMVTPLWLYWASTFKGARSAIEAYRGMPFLQAVYSDVPYQWQKFPEHPFSLCDMQALGIYASESEKHKYSIRQLDGPLDMPVKQFWSHAPFEEAKLRAFII